VIFLCQLLSITIVLGFGVTNLISQLNEIVALGARPEDFSEEKKNVFRSVVFFILGFGVRFAASLLFTAEIYSITDLGEYKPSRSSLSYPSAVMSCQHSSAYTFTGKTSQSARSSLRTVKDKKRVRRRDRGRAARQAPALSST